MVRHGRIAVNGKPVTELPVMVDPERDRVAVDGEVVHLKTKEIEPRVYLLMNKPKGVYSTNVAQGEQTRAIDLLPPDLPGRVYPVGRLDSESKGLLLLTNDGELTNRLTHPRYEVAKAYRVQLRRPPAEADLRRLAAGVELEDGMTGPAEVRRVREGEIEVILREGRNRQVRRMVAAVGNEVVALRRISFGSIELGELPEGEGRRLGEEEVGRLWEDAES